MTFHPHRTNRRPGWLNFLPALVSSLLLACRDATVQDRPARIQLSATSMGFDAVGDSAIVTATVLDRHYAAVAGASVAWNIAGSAASVAPSSGSTNASGTVTATVHAMRNGSASVTVAIGAISSDLSVEVHQTATALNKVAGDGQAGVVGAALPEPLSVRVTDRLGSPVANATLHATVILGGGSVSAPSITTDDAGNATVRWVLGNVVTDRQELSIAFPNGTGLAFTASALPGSAARIQTFAGDNQAGLAAVPLPIAPTVRVTDAFDNPIANIIVDFISSAGAHVDRSEAITDSRGMASAGSWRLGDASIFNTVIASVAGLPPLQFRAAACEDGPGTVYRITLCYHSAMSTARRQAFLDAAARWASVIDADLPDQRAEIAEGACSSGSPSLAGEIDDLLIFADVEPIDGVGGVLGAAGWCLKRAGGLPVIGAMRFDSADVIRLEDTGQLGLVLLHEMGHVLGFGTLWTQAGLLQNPSTTSSRIDTYFSGARAIEAFDAAGGTEYLGGNKVPVENLGSAGTINAHWRKSVMDNELMTGFLTAGLNPLSAVTVGSLKDLGYAVDAGAADPFSLSLVTPQVSARMPSVILGEDIFRGPQWAIDRLGRLTRIR